MSHLTSPVSSSAAVLLSCFALACTGQIDTGPVNGGVEMGASRFPRLTHTQWRNATRDLLRLEATPTNPLDEGVSSGLFASGAELSISGNRAEVRVLKDSLARAAGVTVVGDTAFVLVGLTKAVAVPYRP